MNPKKVMATYKFPNGHVATFGWNGEQIPELQGAYSTELLSRIADRADLRTQWHGMMPSQLPDDQLRLYKHLGKGEHIGLCIIVLAKGIGQAAKMIKKQAGVYAFNTPIDIQVIPMDGPSVVYSDTSKCEIYEN